MLSGDGEGEVDSSVWGLEGDVIDVWCPAFSPLSRWTHQSPVLVFELKEDQENVIVIDLWYDPRPSFGLDTRDF